MIATENYYQHAEHYYRLINESGGYQQQRQNPNMQGGQGQHGQDGRFGPGGEFEALYRYQHQSNAGLGDDNPGVNFHLFTLGYHF